MILRLYLDSNVFITAVEQEEAEQGVLHDVMRRIEQGHARAFTSDLALAEVLVVPYEEENRELAETYLNLISSSSAMLVMPVDRETLIRAARLRSLRKSMKLPDAIHLATAELMDCSIVLSNDAELRPRAPMERCGLDRDSLSHLLKRFP